MKSHLARKAASTLIATLMASFLTAIGLTATSTAESVWIIDTHAHIIRGLRRGIPAATGGQALRVMDDYQVEMTILLPPPFPPGIRVLTAAGKSHQWFASIHAVLPLLPGESRLTR